MTLPYDTGEESDFDNGSWPDEKLANLNAEGVVYDSDSGEWFAVWMDMTYPVVDRSVIVGRGKEDGPWETVKLVTRELSGGLIMNGPFTGDVFNCSIAYDDNANEVHVAWLTTDGSTDWQLYHAKCTAPLSFGTVTNWYDWGGGTRYQAVSDNPTYPIELFCLFVDTSTNRPVVVWNQHNTSSQYEIWINVGGGTGGAFTSVSSFCISTNGATETNNHYRSPTGLCVSEIGTEFYVSYYTDYSSGPTYNVICKRLDDGNTWGTYANWLGPSGGQTSGDIIISDSNNSIGLTLGSSYWYDAPGPLTQYFVAAPLDGDVYTNWFDEGGNILAAETWLHLAGSGLGITGMAPSGRCAVANVNANDFRTFWWKDKTFYFKDTDEGSGLLHPTGDTYEILNDPLKGGWCSIERWGDQVTNSESVVMFVEDTTGGAQPYLDEPIYFIYVKGNAQPIVTISLPKDGSGEDEEDQIVMMWDFNDSDNDAQRDFFLQVDEYGGDFSSPVASASGNVPPPFTVENSSLAPNTLSTGTRYQWRIKVWDDNYGTEYGYNAESEWSDTENFWTNLPPELNITEYIQHPETRWPRITYTLVQNAQKSLAMGTAQYRVDAGSWLDMTEKSGVGSEGLSGLSTGTPTPDTHRFWWNAEVDEVGIYSTDIDIRMEGYVTGKDLNLSTGMEEELNGSLDTKVPTISLSLPPDEDEVLNTTPTFVWNNAVDDSALWSSGAHLWELDAVETFNSGSLRQSGWTDDTEWTPALSLDRGIVYYWRVKASDNFLNVGSSDTWEITVQALGLTDYVKIVDNEKMYKLRNFTIKMSENSAAVLSSTIGEELEES